MTPNIATYCTTIKEHIQFGRYKIAPQHVVYQSPSGLSRVIVNLRPLVPNHLLVLSSRIAPQLADLSKEEYLDLWDTVRLMQEALKAQSPNETLSFNVAVQDGAAAGQSVPHVHVHILPRTDTLGDKYNSENRNDDIYEDLEDWSAKPCKASDGISSKGGVGAKNDDASHKLAVKPDDERKDRTYEEMAEEASNLRKALAKAKTTPDPC